MTEGDDEVLAMAITRLLRAEMAFTRAYDAWSHSPVRVADRRRSELERAERELTRAQLDASIVSSHRKA